MSSHDLAMDRVPAALADAEVVSSSGARVRLGSTWANRPVALVFVRHFG